MKLAAIGIISTNIAESLKFYKHFQLNFTAISDEHYECELDNGIRLMIDSTELIKKINPDFKATKNSHLSLCFELSSPEAVDLLVSQLVDASYTITKKPWDAFWGQRYAIVQDPDGTPIDIYANLTKETK